MTRVINFDKHIGQVIHGFYRVLKVERRIWHRADKPSMVLTIADATGAGLCLGAIEPDDIGLDGATAVRISGEVRQSKQGRLFIQMKECIPLLSVSAGSWHLLPRCWVPENAHSAFDRLLALLDRIDNPELSQFMNRMFAEQAIAEPYLCVPGSRSHHHAYPGGLLIHSLECAEAIEKLNSFFMTEHECALGVVAALVHDIAKVRTLVDQSRNDLPIRGVTQEALNLEILAPFLAKLNNEWRDGADALREILAPSRGYGSQRSVASLLPTDIIRYVDRMSAGSELRSSHFRHVPDRQRCIRTRHGQLMVRVLPPTRQVEVNHAAF